MRGRKQWALTCDKRVRVWIQGEGARRVHLRAGAKGTGAVLITELCDDSERGYNLTAWELVEQAEKQYGIQPWNIHNRGVYPLRPKGYYAQEAKA